MSRELQNICSRTKKKTRVKILKFESKKYASRFEKKSTRVAKKRMLTSCDINRCLHFTETWFSIQSSGLLATMYSPSLLDLSRIWKGSLVKLHMTVQKSYFGALTSTKGRA